MTPKKRKPRKEPRRPTDKLDCLYRAVQDYIESQGGTVSVAGPVQILRWPGDRPLKWNLVVSCVGRAPVGKEASGG